MDEREIRGEELRKYIKSKGLTQREAAEKIGVSAPHLANLLKGRDSIGHQVARRICEAFPEINAVYLLTGQGSLTGTQPAAPSPSVSGGGSLLAEVENLREELRRERAEKSRLLDIIEGITKA